MTAVPSDLEGVGPLVVPVPSRPPAAPDPHPAEGRATVDHGPAHRTTNVESFRRAALALLADPSESDAARQHSTEAAAALVAMAAEADPRLARILRPDPDGGGPVIWTVACYQIGDLSPTALKDFADVDGAVQALAHCEERAHVAAELLASSASGRSWTAMMRTGEMVRFQLPGADTGMGTGAGAGGTLGGALGPAAARWAEEASRWTAEAPEPVDGFTPRQLEPVTGMTPELRFTLGRIAEAVQELARRVDDLASGRDVRDQLYALEQTVVELQLQFRVTSRSAAGGRGDLELGVGGAHSPLEPLPRPRPVTGRPATPPGGHAGANAPLAERVLAAVNRAATRRLAAARRHREGECPDRSPGNWYVDGQQPG